VLTAADPAVVLLRSALELFFVRDRSLLELGAGETAITAKLAHHVACLADDAWDVDAEYDRQEEEWLRKSGVAVDSFMRPDLAVHVRGRSGPQNNLLFVEVKRRWAADRSDAKDLAKARRAADVFGYRTAVALSLYGTPSASATRRPVFDPRHSVFRRPSGVFVAGKPVAELAESHEPVFDAEQLRRLRDRADERDALRRAPP
jgi:hypothetical protein